MNPQFWIEPREEGRKLQIVSYYVTCRNWIRHWYKHGRKTSASSHSRLWSNVRSCSMISPWCNSILPSLCLSLTYLTHLDDLFMIELSTSRLCLQP